MAGPAKPEQPAAPQEDPRLRHQDLNDKRPKHGTAQSNFLLLQLAAFKDTVTGKGNKDKPAPPPPRPPPRRPPQQSEQWGQQQV